MNNKTYSFSCPCIYCECQIGLASSRGVESEKALKWFRRMGEKGEEIDLKREKSTFSQFRGKRVSFFENVETFFNRLLYF